MSLGLVWYTLKSLAILLAVFEPLEYLFPTRKQGILRRETGTDALFFFGQYFLWHGVSLSILALVHDHALSHISLRAWTREQPALLVAISAVILGDLAVYWFHRACHHVNFLWRFHAVHHSIETLDWLAAHREHPLDGILTQLVQNVPALLLGVHMELLIGLSIFRGAWGIFIHSNAKLRIGPLRYLLGAPELHHWHHARIAPTPHNFANLAPWVDVLFGTYHCPDEPEETYDLGLVDPWPRGYFAQLLYPFGIKIEARARS